MNDTLSAPTANPDTLFDDTRRRMELRHYGAETIKAYLGQLRAFMRHIAPRHPRDASVEEMKTYLLGLIATHRSRSTVDQAVNALRFLCREVYDRPYGLEDLPRPDKKKPAPVVLTLDEVKRIAVSVENQKHRLMIELAYSAGLRVSEIIKVRVKQVDLNRLALYVPGEGDKKKGRITIFSASLKDAIARQIGRKGPDDYLFPSERGGSMTTRAVSKFFKAALAASGVEKEATPHSLRHSFATFLLKNGTDLPTLQTLLGHLRRESTNVYRKIAG